MLPRSTAAVAEVVRVCGREGLAVVPQGGNTGLCGGATAPGGGVIINLSRMKRIRALEPLENTLTVEAGCTLGAVKAAAAAHERLFPLSLAPEGSCQIGGNLSTNAGGHQVLRFGMSRDLVLGLEVVLASGEVLDLLSGLRKDNRGYDLKQLFLGAEGTLGIITAATLRLYPLPRQVITALVQLADIPNAVPLLRLLQGQLGDRVTAFELMGRSGVELVQRSVPRSVNPLPAAQWMVLLEISDVQPGEGYRLQLEAGLAEGAAQGLLDRCGRRTQYRTSAGALATAGGHIGCHAQRGRVAQARCLRSVEEHRGLRDPSDRGGACSDARRPARGVRPRRRRQPAFHRSLKGLVLREEVYGKDGSDSENVPYTALEQAYVARRVQPRGRNRHAIFFTHPASR